MTTQKSASLIKILILVVLLSNKVHNESIVYTDTMCISTISTGVYIRSGVAMVEIGIPLLVIPPDLEECAKEGMLVVNETLSSMLEPLIHAIEQRHVSSTTIHQPTRRPRFLIALALLSIALLSGAAFGMSAAALAISSQNKHAINQLRGDVTKLRDSLEGVIGVTEKNVVAISAIQNYIGGVIIPALKQLQCQSQETEVLARASLSLHKIEPLIGQLIDDLGDGPFPTSLITPDIVTYIKSNIAIDEHTATYYGGSTESWLRDSKLTVTGYDPTSTTIWGIISLPIYTPFEGGQLIEMSCLCQNQPGSDTPRRVSVKPFYLEVDGTLFNLPPQTIRSRNNLTAITEWGASEVTPEVQDCLLNQTLSKCLFETCPYSIWSYMLQIGTTYIVNSNNQVPRCLRPIKPVAGEDIGGGLRSIKPNECSNWLFGSTMITMMDGPNGSFVIAPRSNISKPISFPIQEFINPLNVTEALDKLHQIEKELREIKDEGMSDHHEAMLYYCFGVAILVTVYIMYRIIIITQSIKQACNRLRSKSSTSSSAVTLS